ncbi:Zn-dependent M28 family amino/carboxypeptidase [Sphingomonas sp. SORGH_AS802]|uniref:M28 family metallopeptidase n=1 Tax=unclassified Sphingomonas TaxID=196159 RepID=UPI00285858D9|nr:MULTISPECIES: M28 family metallopeptidase [unclassified Sphingomonas]MDR6127877.1 Zn-dependent M28 family amino/carboxypeptidase [Sphingomonas sp. SORGH_AS_0438]MDR6133212.1 Zn-dependent M28 family amino/carboxypeptidase [Sphingomonas sp. SORGH_AS_0802]
MKILTPALLVLTPLLTGAAPAAPSPVSPDRLSADVRTLASESFQGRAPGTPGESKTIDWLVAQFKAMGLQPGGRDGQWTQAVPLIRTRIGDGPVSANGTAWTQGRDVYLSSVRPDSRETVKDAPLVFVGYGVSAPEQNWDDFKGVDLKGKVAVFLVNDPDFEAAAGDDSTGRFGGRRMTYYGRWTYKFEEAARRGAVAALIVHDTPGAGYGWATVTAPAGENYDVARPPAPRVALQGWIEGGAATRLFQAAGLDLAALRKAARRSDFRPVPIPGTGFSADLPVAVTRAESRNVLAKLPGTSRPGEVVMYGAHWDAYGIGAPDTEGRTIRPGANDDALGVAGVLEIARAAAKGPRPARSQVFALWTGEERGLLGSETYAADPIYPAATTVANLTLDILQTAGPSRDVLLVGQGQNALEDRLAAAARAQGRVVTPEALPERGLFYRADHFSVARRGVPTLLLMAISGAPDLVEGGRTAGQAWLDGYMRCYHQTCDAWSKEWDLRGAAADVDLIRRVGFDLARGSDWPEWRQGSEFRAVRAESAAARRR